MLVDATNIPHHFCKNCGECCGPVPINIVEFKIISEFVKDIKPKYNKKPGMLSCKFRVDNKCTIYPVRPMLCKLMGVTKGMTCNFGNTHEIDGTQYMDRSVGMVGLINQVIKTDY